MAKAELYRAILAVFARSREQFMTHLRPGEVVPCIKRDEEETANALRMLEQWGNLEATQDTAEAAAIEEFYRSRFLYALSAPGEAAERALALFDETLHQPGELQTAALRDIIDFLKRFGSSSRVRSRDAAKLHTQLLALTERFGNLTNRAQAFMWDLQSTIQLHGVSVARDIGTASTASRSCCHRQPEMVEKRRLAGENAVQLRLGATPACAVLAWQARIHNATHLVRSDDGG